MCISNKQKQQIYVCTYPRRAHQGPAHEGPGGLTRARPATDQGGPQGPGGAHKGLAHKMPQGAP